MRWLKNIFLKRKLEAEKAGLPIQVVELLSAKQASALREILLSEVPKGVVDKAILLKRAQAEGWGGRELEKLEVYFLFFSGDSALAYQKVMQENLAEEDFDLLMTACVHCYLHNRFVEGYELVRRYEPSNYQGFSAENYYPNAGYLAYVGGAGIGEAIRYFDKLEMMTPALAINAYMIYFSAGYFEKADQLASYIRTECANNALAMYALSWVELSKDYYPEGFRLAEERYTMGAETARFIDPKVAAFSLWTGEDIAGKTLVIYGEQGLGDIIMMARYFPGLHARGGKIIIDAPDTLISLLSINFPYCQFISRLNDWIGKQEFDWWCGIMSLPFHFSTKNDTVPLTAGYLQPPEEQRVYWKQRVQELNPKGKLKVGIAWSGNPNHRYDRIRSLSYELVAPYISAFSNIEFFCLQMAEPPENGRLHYLAEEMVSMADTAALISEMDLVITIDTSIVHLAGALAVPTWLLLPFRYEWRWSLAGERNNWYDSVSVIRQADHGGWKDVLAEVFEDRLPNYISSKCIN